MKKRVMATGRPWRASLYLRATLLVTLILFSVLLYWHLGGSERRRWRENRLLFKLWQDQASLKHQFALHISSRLLPGESAPSKGKKQGIVICAGGNVLLVNTYVSVKVLRTILNSTLPIEIYHFGPIDVGPITRGAFQAFHNVSFVDLNTLAYPWHQLKPRKLHGYVQKILSLYSTEFEQVLLLDADSQPLKDPALLFESASFRNNGNLFWSDFWPQGFPESPEEVVYQWLGLEPPWNRIQDWRCAESGQVLIDRVRHADVLEWLWFLNSHAELLYDHMLGDKDTFEIAFSLAGKSADYKRVIYGPGLPVSPLQPAVHLPNFWLRHFGKKEEGTRYLRLGMLQFDELAEPAFLHRTERTKFNGKNGYPISLMHPEFFVPPLSVDVTTKVRSKVWRMHSIPASIADVNCTCCTLDASAKAVVRKAAKRSGKAIPEKHSLTRCSPLEGGIPRIPLFPIVMLGPGFAAAVDAAFDAYRDLQSLFGTKLRSKISP